MTTSSSSSKLVLEFASRLRMTAARRHQRRTHAKSWAPTKNSNVAWENDVVYLGNSQAYRHISFEDACGSLDDFLVDPSGVNPSLGGVLGDPVIVAPAEDKTAETDEKICLVDYHWSVDYVCTKMCEKFEGGKQGTTSHTCEITAEEQKSFSPTNGRKKRGGGKRGKRGIGLLFSSWTPDLIQCIEHDPIIPPAAWENDVVYLGNKGAYRHISFEDACGSLDDFLLDSGVNPSLGGGLGDPMIVAPAENKTATNEKICLVDYHWSVDYMCTKMCEKFEGGKQGTTSHTCEITEQDQINFEPIIGGGKKRGGGKRSKRGFFFLGFSFWTPDLIQCIDNSINLGNLAGDVVYLGNGFGYLKVDHSVCEGGNIESLGGKVTYKIVTNSAAVTGSRVSRDEKSAKRGKRVSADASICHLVDYQLIATHYCNAFCESFENGGGHGGKVYYTCDITADIQKGVLRKGIQNANREEPCCATMPPVTVLTSWSPQLGSICIDRSSADKCRFIKDPNAIWYSSSLGHMSHAFPGGYGIKFCLSHLGYSFPGNGAMPFIVYLCQCDGVLNATGVNWEGIKEKFWIHVPKGYNINGDPEHVQQHLLSQEFGTTIPNCEYLDIENAPASLTDSSPDF